MRGWIALLLAALLLGGCGLQVAAEPVVIAVLLSDDVRQPKVDGLRQGLALLGYDENRVQIQVYSARGNREELRVRAEEALRSGPVLAIAGGFAEAVVLRAVVPLEVPVVLMGVASTVRSGLIESFARPGGSMTGLDNQHAELSAKRLELLIKLLPEVRRVLVMYDPLVIPGRHALEVTAAAAGRLGVTLTELPVETPEQALQAVRAIEPGQYDAALFLPAFVLEMGAAQLAPEWERLRLPVMGPLEAEAGAGLFAAYGVSMRDQGFQSARFVAMILRGQKPGIIPVETPDNPRLVVDLGVTRRLGLTLSPVGMAFAHTVGGERP